MINTLCCDLIENSHASVILYTFENVLNIRSCQRDAVVPAREPESQRLGVT